MSKRKKIIILGATGSIGTSCIDIVRKNPDLFQIVGISAHRNENILHQLASEFQVKQSVLSLRDGEKKLLSMIRETDADIVVNGICGASGLLPSIASLESKKDLALANKETIVMAGPLIKELAKKNNKKILPVDSEHSAIFTLVNGFGIEHIEEIILTASGGPFRTWDSEKILQATLSDALAHPTWSMGAKITIDSASLANKGLEVIEACQLFDFPFEKVKVVVHPQSLVHSFIRTKDGVLYAQISKPDMRHPILSALTWPEIISNHLEALTFDQVCTMQFEKPRYSDFPLLTLAYRAVELAGGYSIAYNAANEIAVASFLEGNIRFSKLAEVTSRVFDHDWSISPSTFDEVFLLDAQARKCAQAALIGMDK